MKPIQRVTHHMAQLLQLATPIVITRAGMFVMVLVDVAMVGRYGTTDLAYLQLGAVMNSIGWVPAIGLAVGTLVMTANAYGAGRLQHCGAVWRRAVPYTFAIGLALLVFSFLGEPMLRLLGQTEHVARGAGQVMIIYGLGLPFGMIYMACSFFLEGIKKPLPVTVVMVLANLTNVLMNWLLIYGNAGFPELGAEGSAWATTINRVLMTVALFAYVWFMKDHAKFGVRLKHAPEPHAARQQRRIGYGAAGSNAVEHAAFAMLSIYAGWISEAALAAVGIVFNLFGMFFMVALGVGSATAVLVGNAHGAQDWRDLAWSGWTGLVLAFVLLLPFGLAFWFLPGFLPGLFTTDIAVIAVAIPLAQISAFAIFFDGAQAVMINALRGRGESLAPTVLHFISYIVVMMPLCWFLAFVLDRGTAGLFEGVLIASIISTVLTAARFHYLSLQDRGGVFIAKPVAGE